MGIRGLGGLGSGGAGSTPFDSSRLDYNRDNQLNVGHRLFDDGHGASIGELEVPSAAIDTRSSLLRNNTHMNGDLLSVNRPLIGRRNSPNSDFRNPASEVTLYFDTLLCTFICVNPRN
jgi:hypothetical protein